MVDFSPATSSTAAASTNVTSSPTAMDPGPSPRTSATWHPASSGAPLPGPDVERRNTMPEWRSSSVQLSSEPASANELLSRLPRPVQDQISLLARSLAPMARMMRASHEAQGESDFPPLDKEVRVPAADPQAGVARAGYSVKLSRVAEVDAGPSRPDAPGAISVSVRKAGAGASLSGHFEWIDQPSSYTYFSKIGSLPDDAAAQSARQGIYLLGMALARLPAGKGQDIVTSEQKRWMKLRLPQEQAAGSPTAYDVKLDVDGGNWKMKVRDVHAKCALQVGFISRADGKRPAPTTAAGSSLSAQADGQASDGDGKSGRPPKKKVRIDPGVLDHNEKFHEVVRNNQNWSQDFEDSWVFGGGRVPTAWNGSTWR